MARTAADGPDAPIEFLAPDERAFGDDPGIEFVGLDGGDDPFDDGAPRSVWLGSAAVVTVTALIAAGVAAAAPWRDDDTAAVPVTTTTDAAAPGTAATTVAPRVRSDRAPLDTVGDASGPVLYVIDPAPPTLELTERGPGFDTNEPTGWSEVWATEDATRTSGRWFSVTLLPFTEREESRDPVTSVDVDGRPGQLTTTPDGVSTLQFDRSEPDASRLIVVSGFGVDVLAVARSIGIVDDRPQLVDDRPVYRDPALLDGLARIAGAPATRPLVDRVLFPDPLTTYSVYRHTGEPGVRRRGTVLVQSSPLDESDDALAELASVRIGQLPGTWRVPSGFDGDDLALSTRWFAGVSLHMARWRTADVQITVLTDRPFEELLALLPAVRAAT